MISARLVRSGAPVALVAWMGGCQGARARDDAPAAPSAVAWSAPASASAAASDPGEGPAASASASGSAEAPGAALPAEQEPVEGGSNKLAAIAVQTWVYEGPNDETPKLGYLRAGAILDRGERPVAMTKRCPKGWYKVAPRGYVCDGKRATTDLDHPVAKATWKPPKRGEPLPYRYARAKEQPPYLYVRVPSPKEQERAEWMKHADRIREVPVARLLPLVGEVEPLPPFLASGQVLPKPFGATQRLHVGAHEGKAGPKSAFAFLSVHEIDGRLFGLSTDLQLIALDRVQLVKLTDIHGGPVDDLPAGILLGGGGVRHTVDEKGTPKAEGRLDPYDVVSLTGKTKGDLWEAKDGAWISAAQMRVVKPREGWPTFLRTDGPPRKWIDVSINDQILVAYEGTRAVFVTRVSTGLGGLGDPEKTTATKRGSFSIKSKHLTTTMRGEESVDDYELGDVPYVQYFEEGYALHAAFWHERFGNPHSHGCVNLTPRDAAWLFEWTDPPVPPGWHGVQAHGGEGTIVHTRP
ncbi:MAG: L,D-transpeptidase [Polyangiaceae bacterium]|nr:L,D-transpeptidase [Polyangiaceae bacterium]